jgi:PqqD family protein of HPr-rel-A system
MHIERIISLSNDKVVRYWFWGDECVVYYQPNMNTHLIEGVGSWLFGHLAKKAFKQSELHRDLYNYFELPNNFDVETFLNQLISEYQALGLLNITEAYSV